MNSGFYQGLEYIGTKINRASTTKQSIITAANSYEYIKQKIKEIEENTKDEMENVKPQNFKFNPNEVEPIVLKKKEEEER